MIAAVDLRNTQSAVGAPTNASASGSAQAFSDQLSASLNKLTAGNDSSQPVAETEAATEPSVQLSGQVNPPQPTIYEVRAGDNLTKIARRFDTTVNNLANLNGIENPDLILIGQRLKISDQSNGGAAQPALAAAATPATATVVQTAQPSQTVVSDSRDSQQAPSQTSPVVDTAEKAGVDEVVVWHNATDSDLPDSVRISSAAGTAAEAASKTETRRPLPDASAPFSTDEPKPAANYDSEPATAESQRSFAEFMLGYRGNTNNASGAWQDQFQGVASPFSSVASLSADPTDTSPDVRRNLLTKLIQDLRERTGNASTRLQREYGGAVDLDPEDQTFFVSGDELAAVLAEPENLVGLGMLGASALLDQLDDGSLGARLTDGKGGISMQRQLSDSVRVKAYMSPLDQHLEMYFGDALKARYATDQTLGLVMPVQKHALYLNHDLVDNITDAGITGRIPRTSLGYNAKMEFDHSDNSFGVAAGVSMKF